MLADPSPSSSCSGPLKHTRRIAIGVVVAPKASANAVGGTLPRVLISRRLDEAVVLAGYWEFPGGKVEAGEKVDAALRRELSEELGIDVIPARALTPVEHAYPHGVVRLEPWLCRLAEGSAAPQALQVAEWRWVTLAELASYRFPEANASLLAEVVAALQ